MADKIVGIYDIKVDKALKSLDKLEKKVEEVDKESKKSAKSVGNNYNGMADKMSAQFKRVGVAALAAFSIDRIVSYGKEAIKLAGQLEGVERAFKRIGDPKLLQELRNATKGTVSDLQLMQQAVRASNFKIPLESLAQLFEFARRRAKETGESVDFLVNSIISGIGRKSPLILDNLGISAVELRKRLRGVGVEAANVGQLAEIIGAIATEELGKMGEEVTTTGDKIIQMQTATENLKIAIGKLLAEKASPFIEFLGNVAGAIEKDITALDKLREQLTGESGLTLLARQTEEIAKLKELEKEATEAAGKVSDAEFIKLNEKVKTQREIVDAIEQELLNRTANNDETEITVDLINREVDAYRKLKQEQQENSITINSLTKELKNYNKDLKDAEVGSSKFFSILDKVNEKTKELNEAIALTKLEDALKVDEEEDIIISDAEIENFNRWAREEFPDAVTEGVDIADQKWQELFKSLMDGAGNAGEQIQADFFDFAFAASDLAFNIASLQSSLIEQELQNLEAAYEAGNITREEFEDERKRLLREQAEAQKTAALFQATIDGFAAVVATFRVDPTGILAAIVGATVATNIASIAAQPLPEFAEGGFINEHGELKGRKHRQGGIRIEAEGGEFITAAKYAQPNAEILRAINSGQWEKYKVDNIIAPAIEQVLEGGFNNIGASMSLQNNFNDRNLLKAIDRHRNSDKDGFVYLANELKKMNPRKRGGFA